MKPQIKIGNLACANGNGIFGTISRKLRKKTKDEEQCFEIKSLDDFSVSIYPESKISVDLFEHPECIPDEVQTVLNKFEKKMIDGMTYKDCASLVIKLQVVGYTCDYYLDAQPYFLRKYIKLIDIIDSEI